MAFFLSQTQTTIFKDLYAAPSLYMLCSIYKEKNILNYNLYEDGLGIFAATANNNNLINIINECEYLNYIVILK